MYLKDEVNAATTLTIGAFNSVDETTTNSLNIYKVTQFRTDVILHGSFSSTTAFVGQLKPPSSGGTIYGVLDQIMNYDVTAATDPQHQFKINGGIMMMINNNSVTSYGVMNCAAGIRCNSPSSSFLCWWW